MVIDYTTFEQLHSVDLSKILMGLFTVGTDDVKIIWTGAARYVPSPLKKQMEKVPSGSRAIYCAMNFPKFQEKGAGLTGNVDGMGLQLYSFDVSCFQKVAENVVSSIPQVEEDSANFLLEKLGVWKEQLIHGETTDNTSDEFKIQSATIDGGTFETAEALHKMGWYGVTIRISVLVSVPRHKKN